MSGINGPCNQPCKLGQPHQFDCHNYIEVELPCPVCDARFGRHEAACVLALRSADPSQGVS